MDRSDEPNVKAYGFLEAVTFPEEKSNPRGRMNLVLDSIKTEAIETGTAHNRLASDLLIVRILTTRGRLESLFPTVNWDEGGWVQFELRDSPGLPRAWYLSAEADYSGSVVRTNLISATALSGNPLGPAKVVGKLQELCAPTAAVRIQKQRQYSPKSRIPGPFVRVVDVGHASFSTVHEGNHIGSKILGYFDVGGPVFFHHRTFPASFLEAGRVPASGFVVLSHWDFDHYSLAVSKIPALRSLNWYAPDQPVGPNAASLQAKLGSRLSLISAPTYSLTPSIHLWKGNGALTDRNGSGYVMRITRAGGGVLLSGDVPYSMLPPGVENQLVALAVTHHGGSFTGSPPVPLKAGATAAVSYGLPNRYHHPHAPSIDLHVTAGWQIAPTYITAKKRGDVWL